MTHHEIAQRINAFIEDDEHTFLKERFAETSRWFLELSRVQNEYFNSRGGERENAEVDRVVGFADSQLRTWKHAKLFRQIESLSKSIDDLNLMSVTAMFHELRIPPLEDNEAVLKYNDLVNVNLTLELLPTFEKAHENFLSVSNVSGVYWVLEVGHAIHNQLVAVSLALRDLRDELQSTNGIRLSESESELRILIGGSDKLEVTISKLAALNAIYTEYCKLLNTSIKDNPLRVGKLETGSLWLKLFGENRIITLITDGIRETASFLYRTQTNEGRFRTKIEQRHDLENLAGLVSKLEKLGIDTSGIKETLKQSGEKIARLQLEFLSGEAEVTLNDEKLQLEPPLAHARLDHIFTESPPLKHLPESKKLLESGNLDKDE